MTKVNVDREYGSKTQVCRLSRLRALLKVTASVCQGQIHCICQWASFFGIVSAFISTDRTNTTELIRHQVGHGIRVLTKIKDVLWSVYRSACRHVGMTWLDGNTRM